MAARHVRVCEFAVEPDRGIEVGDCSNQFAPTGEALATIVIGDRDFRMESDRLVQVGHGVVVVALSRPCVGAPEIDLGEIGILEFARGDQASAGLDRWIRRAVRTEAGGAIVGRGRRADKTGHDKTDRDEPEQAVHDSQSSMAHPRLAC
jgi:hypothetical protein